jgi:putative flippase GtrA
VSLANLGLNTLIIYVLVEYLHIWYLFSAVMAGALIAFGSFFIYRHLIFKEHPKQSPESEPLGQKKAL